MPTDRDTLARVDHLVVATPDVMAGIAKVEQHLGVRATPGGRHPSWGTRNALLALGPETYLEIVGPDPDRISPAVPTLFGIDRLQTPRLVTWAAKAHDLESAVARASRAGLQLGSVRTGSRDTPDGTMLRWRLTDPLEDRGGGVVPFLIDWGTTASPAPASAQGCRLVGLRLEHPDASRVRAWLAALDLGLPVANAARPALIATIASPHGSVELA